jgi:hypothetical protein
LRKIFISHSSKNEAFIKKLKKQFPKRDYLVWASFEDIRPGRDFGEKIKKKLSECDVIIFILTNPFAACPAACRGEECMPFRGGYKGDRKVPPYPARPVLGSMINYRGDAPTNESFGLRHVLPSGLVPEVSKEDL